MKCEQCFCGTRVIDSRENKDCWRRRRECTVCGYRFTTTELSADRYAALVKSTKMLARIKADLRVEDVTDDT